MNGLIGMADLALNLAVDPTQRESLQIAKSSAMSLLQIINDILDFSKIEAGKLAIERIDFDMAQLLSESLRPMAVKAAEKGLELVLDIDDDFPAIVRGDPGRLRQILLNLVSNAIKFTMQGEVVVSASTRLDGPTAQVDLSVTDTGLGIEAASLATLFDPFTQEDSTITRRFGGTGLGLSITRRLNDPKRLLSGRRIAVVDDHPRKKLGSIGSRPGEFAAAIVDLSIPEIAGRPRFAGDTDHRHDRQRHGGRSRALSGRRHGRLHLQADPDTISIIAESFIESMEADFTRMDTALAVLDWPEVMRLAHSAKGLCLTFHADPLADDFARLTTMARSGGIDAQPAQAILDSARTMWPAFVSALLARLRTLSIGQ